MRGHHHPGPSVADGTELFGDGLEAEHEVCVVPDEPTNFVSQELLTRDIHLEAGLVIAVEPMVAMGSADVVIDRKDGWTVRTRDGGPAAHFEHTLAVTADGVSVLTDGS